MHREKERTTIDTSPIYETSLSSIFHDPRRLLDFQRLSDSNPTDNWNSPQTTAANSYLWKGNELFKKNFSGDRFIPLRKTVNTNAFNFKYQGKLVKVENENELQVLPQLKFLTTEWRKRVMNERMLEMNLFPGLRQARILKLCEMTTETSNKSKYRTKGYSDDKFWECRPRKRPLIVQSQKDYENHDIHQIQQIFRFPFQIRGKYLVDWSIKNEIVMAIDEGTGVFNADSPSSLSYLSYLGSEDDITVVKWNNSGTRFAIGRVDSTVSVKCEQVEEDVLWYRQCPCDKIPECEIVIVCWSSTDKFIVSACSNGRLNNIVANTGKVQNTEFCDAGIIYIALSPNDKFLAVSFHDKSVKIISWPDFQPYMNVHYYKRIKAIAWHPWNNHILCIGGGHHDGSLTVWNINTQKPLQYRTIDFMGAVENLTFNKLTGELIVHWICLEHNRREVKIVVLASLDRIVDFIPIYKDKILNFTWNPDHTKIALSYNNTLSIWNIFGQEDHLIKKRKKEIHIPTFIHTFPNESYSSLSTVSKGLQDYNIR
ncbi:protein cortex [Leptopilina heterotoma]|uniref:protein cortex n=1 Tax=Leptopilina heterotoma TaxID=63436 RepID=UPI001CA9F4B4|nr:protein cortex [Leptopilina heterotoma]